MDILVLIVLGIVGAVIGYKIPYISTKIIEYKKHQIDLNIGNSFLYSTYFKMLLCFVNGAIWIISGLGTENILIGILIGIQITIGIIVAFIDITIRIIPNELVLALIIVGITFQILFSGYKSLLYSLICMIVMMAVFISVAGFVGFGKVGAGDVKLAGVMGLTLGYPLIVKAVFIMAIVLMGFISIGLLLKKIYLSTMLPLAPFIISGYLAVLIDIIL